MRNDFHFSKISSANLLMLSRWLTAASQGIDADMANSETESTRQEQWGTGA